VRRRHDASPRFTVTGFGTAARIAEIVAKADAGCCVLPTVRVRPVRDDSGR
jgi:hypothetical protein